MKKIKIAVVVPSLKQTAPYFVAKDICEYLDINEFEIVYVPLRENYDDVSIKKTDLKIDMGKLPFLNTVKKLKKILNHEQVDIVFAHTFWPTILTSFLSDSFIIVTTIHNNPFEDYCFEYGKIVGKIMAKYLISRLKKYASVVSISNYVAQSLRDIDSDVIHNGIKDVGYCTNASKQNNTINIVQVGVLNKIKNNIFSLEIIESCKKKGLSVQLNIIGDGPELHNLKDFVEMRNLQQNVRFLGQLERNEVYNYIKNASCLIHTSLSEGFGLVLIEAFMLGVPVITWNRGVYPEIVEQGINGILASNIEEFTDAILYCNQEQFGKGARKTYEQKFTSQIMSTQYAELFRKCLSEANQ